MLMKSSKLTLLYRSTAFISVLGIVSCGGGGGASAPAVPNRAPVITDPGSLVVLEGAASVASLSATDADGDALTFSITAGDDQSLFTMTSAGVLSFIAA